MMTSRSSSEIDIGKSTKVPGRDAHAGTHLRSEARKGCLHTSTSGSRSTNPCRRITTSQESATGSTPQSELAESSRNGGAMQSNGANCSSSTRRFTAKAADGRARWRCSAAKLTARNTPTSSSVGASSAWTTEPRRSDADTSACTKWEAEASGFTRNGKLRRPAPLSANERRRPCNDATAGA